MGRELSAYMGIQPNAEGYTPSSQHVYIGGIGGNRPILSTILSTTIASYLSIYLSILLTGNATHAAGLELGTKQGTPGIDVYATQRGRYI